MARNWNGHEPDALFLVNAVRRRHQRALLVGQLAELVQERGPAHLQRGVLGLEKLLEPRHVLQQREAHELGEARHVESLRADPVDRHAGAHGRPGLTGLRAMCNRMQGWGVHERALIRQQHT